MFTPPSSVIPHNPYSALCPCDPVCEAEFERLEQLFEVGIKDAHMRCDWCKQQTRMRAEHEMPELWMYPVCNATPA